MLFIALQTQDSLEPSFPSLLVYNTSLKTFKMKLDFCVKAAVGGLWMNLVHIVPWPPEQLLSPVHGSAFPTGL